MRRQPLHARPTLAHPDPTDGPSRPQSPSWPGQTSRAAATLHLSPLVRQLHALGLAEPAADAAPADTEPVDTRPEPSLAERLAPWLAWTDAISLSGTLAGALQASALQSGTPAQAKAAHGQAVAARAAVQSRLAQAIACDEPDGLSADDLPADATPGRRYRAHQQAMERHITPLRAQVRRALALQSGALARIAQLDHHMEQALAGRERQLLSAVPAWLDRRLQRAPLPPAALTTPLLLAELAHRLQPVNGMLAALAPLADSRTPDVDGDIQPQRTDVSPQPLPAMALSDRGQDGRTTPEALA